MLADACTALYILKNENKNGKGLGMTEKIKKAEETLTELFLIPWYIIILVLNIKECTQEQMIVSLCLLLQLSVSV